MQVDVVIPALNAVDWIDATLDAIAGQRGADRLLGQVVVVDDGSIDDTAARAADHRLRPTVLAAEGGGAPAARNLGAAATSAPLLAFCDADDLWLPEKLEAQVSAVEGQGAEVVACLVDEFLDEDRPAAIRPRSGVTGFSGSTILVTRDLWDRVGPFDEDAKHTDIVDWMLRARAFSAREAILDRVLLRRRLVEGSLSRRGLTDSHDDFLDLIRQRVHRQRQATATEGSTHANETTEQP